VAVIQWEHTTTRRILPPPAQWVHIQVVHTIRHMVAMLDGTYRRHTQGPMHLTPSGAPTIIKMEITLITLPQLRVIIRIRPTPKHNILSSLPSSLVRLIHMRTRSLVTIERLIHLHLISPLEIHPQDRWGRTAFLTSRYCGRGDNPQPGALIR